MFSHHTCNTLHCGKVTRPCPVLRIGCTSLAVYSTPSRARRAPAATFLLSTPRRPGGDAGQCLTRCSSSNSSETAAAAEQAQDSQELTSSTSSQHEAALQEAASSRSRSSSGPGSTPPAGEGPAAPLLAEYLRIVGSAALWTWQLAADAVRWPLQPRSGRLMDLRLAAHMDPADAERFAALAAALNEAGQSGEVVDLVDARRFALSSAAAAEYLKALLATGRLSRLGQGGAVQ